MMGVIEKAFEKTWKLLRAMLYIGIYRIRWFALAKAGIGFNFAIDDGMILSTHQSVNEIHTFCISSLSFKVAQDVIKIKIWLWSFFSIFIPNKHTFFCVSIMSRFFLTYRMEFLQQKRRKMIYRGLQIMRKERNASQSMKCV